MSHASDRSEQAEFTRLQQAFAGHIRDPERFEPPAGVPKARMAVYRELFFNNIEGVLAGTFPLVRQQLDNERWLALVRAFFAHHRARTPLFYRLPGEFVGFLEQSAHLPDGLPPYLGELARYGWTEMQLALAEEEPPRPDHAPAAEWSHRPLALSPLARLLELHYPVHRLDAKEPGLAPSPTPLLLFRDRSDTVRSVALTPLTGRLLSQLAPDIASEAILQRLAEEVPHIEPAVVKQGGRDVLRSLLEQGALQILDW